MTKWIKRSIKNLTTGEKLSFAALFGSASDGDGKAGHTFRVWAPNAQNVHLIGDFTNWCWRADSMTSNEGGVWEIHGFAYR